MNVLHGRQSYRKEVHRKQEAVFNDITIVSGDAGRRDHVTAKEPQRDSFRLLVSG